MARELIHSQCGKPLSECSCGGRPFVVGHIVDDIVDGGRFEVIAVYADGGVRLRPMSGSDVRPMTYGHEAAADLRIVGEFSWARH